MNSPMRNRFEVSEESQKLAPDPVEGMGWPPTLLVTCLCAVGYFFLYANVLGDLMSLTFDWFSPLFRWVTDQYGRAYSRPLVLTVAWIVGVASTFLPLPLIALFITRDRVKMTFIALCCLAPILAVALHQGMPDRASAWVTATEPVGAFLLFAALAFKTKALTGASRQ
jgi:hypothetical protein